MKLTLTIPLKPPSVNTYVRHTRAGRHYVTKEGLAFKAAVGIMARGSTVAPVIPGERRKARYSLTARVFLGPKQRGDGDNCWKCIADGLVEAGVIHSDAAVSEWHMYVDGDERGQARTEIEVERL
jgi:crossover junction endodeoxyribonuclease RusA